MVIGGILLSAHFVIANSFVFNDDLLFVEKSSDFVENVSNELFNKTGVSLYVYMATKLKNDSYADFKKQFISTLKIPFVAIVLIRDDKKIDIITSNSDLLDKKKVYWEYMVPLIPQQDSELTPQALSAVVLNGYIESVDLIADNFNVTIEHNVSKDEKGAKMVSQLILYAMLFSMFAIIALIYIFRNKRKV